MIFPRQCKEVGIASTRPCGDQVYFLSRYLIHDTPAGPEILEVTTDPSGKGLMREVVETRVLAYPGETWLYPEKVQLHNRALLVRLASDSGKRCTIFTGIDEHTTFVCDPDLSLFQTVAVYDVIPPRPSLSACIRDLEEAGLFSGLDVTFEHTLRDISQVDADIYSFYGGNSRKKIDAEQIQMRCAMAMVNEAALCLQEGIIESPLDGDIGAVFGLGFPPFRGGPFRYIDTLGVQNVVDMLHDLTAKYGERFEPAQILLDYAKENKKFYTK